MQSAYSWAKEFEGSHPVAARTIVAIAPLGFLCLVVEFVWITYQNLKKGELGMVSFKSLRESHDWLFAAVAFVLIVCIAIIITLIPILYALVDCATLAAVGYLLMRVMQGASFVAMVAILALSTTPWWRRGQTLYRGHYYCPSEKKRGFLWKRCDENGN